jgi:hypothetical protein
MSDTKTNKFEGALSFFLGEFAAADEGMLEDGSMEVFGEDDQGREGSCEVSIHELAQAALDEINHLNKRVKELEKESMSFRAVLDESTNFHPDTDPNYTQGFKDAMRLFEDIYLGEPHHALKKFALEHKVEVFNAWLYEVKLTKGSKL